MLQTIKKVKIQAVPLICPCKSQQSSIIMVVECICTGNCEFVSTPVSEPCSDITTTLSFQHGSIMFKFSPSVSTQNGRTSLIFAAVQGHGEIMLELIKHGANVNAQSEVGLR